LAGEYPARAADEETDCEHLSASPAMQAGTAGGVTASNSDWITGERQPRMTRPLHLGFAARTGEPPAISGVSGSAPGNRHPDSKAHKRGFPAVAPGTPGNIGFAPDIHAARFGLPFILGRYRVIRGGAR